MEEKHNAELALKRERELKVGRGRGVGRGGGRENTDVSGYRTMAGVARWLKNRTPRRGEVGSRCGPGVRRAHCYLPSQLVVTASSSVSLRSTLRHLVRVQPSLPGITSSGVLSAADPDDIPFASALNAAPMRSKPLLTVCVVVLPPGCGGAREGRVRGDGGGAARAGGGDHPGLVAGAPRADGAQGRGQEGGQEGREKGQEEVGARGEEG